MAKTLAAWSCGHGEYRQIHGPNKDRDRYTEWASEEGLCPECYKEVKREEERKAGPRFLVRRVWPRDGETALEVVRHPGSYGAKDELKERGRRFGRRLVVGSNLMEPPRPGWYVRFAKGEGEAAESELEWIGENGWPVEGVGAVTSAFDAVALGRRDLVAPYGPARLETNDKVRPGRGSSARPPGDCQETVEGSV